MSRRHWGSRSGCVLPARNGHRIAAVVWTQPAKASLITLKVITARDGKNSEAFGLNPRP